MIKSIFDQQFIRDLAELLDEKSLTEIELSKGLNKIRLSRQSAQSFTPVMAAPLPAQDINKSASASVSPSDEGEDNTQEVGLVTSPVVGICYLSESPDSGPFVRVGDTVEKNQTLFIIEAMKTFNPIPAPHSGVVRKVLVKDNTPVEFNSPLIIIN